MFLLVNTHRDDIWLGENCFLFLLQINAQHQSVWLFLTQKRAQENQAVMLAKLSFISVFVEQWDHSFLSSDRQSAVIWKKVSPARCPSCYTRSLQNVQMWAHVLAKEEKVSAWFFVFPFFCFNLSQKGMIRQSKKKEEKSSKGWQERYDHLSISFLNIKVGKTGIGDAGHHSVMWPVVSWATVNSLNGQKKAVPFASTWGWLMSPWTVCSPSHGVHDCGHVAPMMLQFVSRKSDADWACSSFIWALYTVLKQSMPGYQCVRLPFTLLGYLPFV